jgi:hypothetical protein
MTDAVVIAVLSLTAALVGYVATYFNNMRMAQRQAKLDRVNRQLSEFYGPLLAISSAGTETWDVFKRYRSAQGIDADFAEWQRWVNYVFMPGNRRLREVIITKADLLIDNDLPKCLTSFCAHVSGWEVALRRWEDGDYSITGSAIDYPVEVDEYARTSFLALKQEQMRLLAGRRRLSRWLHRPSRDTRSVREMSS